MIRAGITITVMVLGAALLVVVMLLGILIGMSL